ncbi:2'-5' RNA ligase [Corynebacterium sp. CNCTC7651]|uniref:2'-5' RNA ligase n=1 Tax=Corynebacterium sp. CNCTC7651 TaxID=2815361 RepID=UPI00351D46E4
MTTEQEHAIRDIYRALAARGLPEQHQRPRISVTFAPTMDRRVVGEAAVTLPPCMPATLRRVGTVVFGTKSKQTVAWLLEAPEELELASRRLSAMNPDGCGDRWIPHLTMGLRIPKAIVPAYIEALAEVTSPHFNELTAERAAFYQPSLGAELKFSG